jgi:protein-L-isoaspartate(D-aspartate) O-methyltransferase
VPDNVREVAYGLRPLPIGFGQTISTPYIVASMTELLELEGSEKVLEIGTGCGYQTAVLCEIVDEVYSPGSPVRQLLRGGGCPCPLARLPTSAELT